MKVTVKLFATLGQYLPQGAANNKVEMEVEVGMILTRIVDSMNLPQELCHLVLVNGVYVEPSARETYVMKENDVLAIWPPVAGG
jgi:sulfur-carrier protein